jgi:ribose transport system permease protein
MTILTRSIAQDSEDQEDFAWQIIRRAWRTTARYRPVLALVMVLVIVFSITQPAFRTSQNIQNTLTSVSVTWIVAMGMTFALLSGGMDISVGALVGLDGIFLAKVTDTGAPQWVALAAVVVFGTALGGLVNGVLIGRFRVNFFVVTLASMTALTGAINLWSGTNSVPINSSFVTGLALNRILGIQETVWLMIIIFAVALYVQNYTYLGRDIYATGGSLQAAKLSGIRTTRTLITVYAIIGLAAAIGSMVAISQVGVASAQVDSSLPLDAIAAVVLGGTTLSGGAGGVQGTVFGVLFLGILSDGLDISGVPSYWQQVATGVIIVAAVITKNGRVSLPKVLHQVRSRRLVTQNSGSAPASQGPAGIGR